MYLELYKEDVTNSDHSVTRHAHREAEHLVDESMIDEMSPLRGPASRKVREGLPISYWDVLATTPAHRKPPLFLLSARPWNATST